MAYGYEPGQNLVAPPHEHEAFSTAAYGSMNAINKLIKN